MVDSVATSGPLVGIVAGEPSGDLLGAALVAALRERHPRARFVGIGGPKMMAAGVESLYPMEKLSVRGYVEVIRHYREIIGIRSDLRRYFLREKPSVFIGIDAPDFNLDLESGRKSHGIPTVHYVSPSIWAWRGGRIRGQRGHPGVVLEFLTHRLGERLPFLQIARLGGIAGEFGLFLQQRKQSRPRLGERRSELVRKPHGFGVLIISRIASSSFAGSSQRMPWQP